MRDDDIVGHLEAHPQRSFKLKELARQLRVPNARYRAFRRQVLDLARDGRIAQLPRRRVQALSGASVLAGTVEGVAGQATGVRSRDGDVLPLAPADVVHVVPGDRVEFRRLRHEGRRVAAVRRTLQAAPRQLFGSLLPVGDRWVLVPDEQIPGLRGGFFLDETTRLQPDDADHLARAWLPGFDPARERPSAVDVEVLGPQDHPQAAIARLIARLGWPADFSPSALDPQTPQPLARLDETRRDLTSWLTVTIDPIDAKDHDDAVSIEVSPDGGYRLGIHIADVACFVERGSALDLEARARATSVYPPGRVLPMLPEHLSADACSLHHGVRRRCLSVVLTYDAAGNRTKIALGPSWIQSQASLSYRHAESILDGEAPALAQRSQVEVPALKAILDPMLALATQLRGRRRDSGSIFLERPEREFIFDDDGHVGEVTTRPLLRSHWIIEEFMLEANRAVAEVLDAAQLPLLWRVHEDPDAIKIGELVETLKGLGLRWKPSDPVGGHDYQQLLKQADDSSLKSLVSTLALRSLMKASYRRGRGGHFGLAFDYYTHFTSPIRRYPDLHNQRWLHALGAKSALSSSDGSWIDDALPFAASIRARELADAADWEEALRLADHCSQQEVRATAIERGARDICAADAIRDLQGERLDGMVVGIVPSGLFVQLEGFGLDGYVGVEELPGDWYTFDERRRRFVGERTGRHFGLGQKVRVLLQHVDVANGRLWLGAIEVAPKR